MAIQDFDSWRAELYETGNLFHDVPDDPEAEELANQQMFRYIGLVKQIRGKGGVDAVVALIGSMRAEEDEGAYEDTMEALEYFPEDELGRGAALAWRELVSIPKKFSGEVLFGCCQTGAGSVGAFNEVYAEMDDEPKRLVGELIEYHENGTWLSGPERGLLRPVRDTFFDSL